MTARSDGVDQDPRPLRSEPLPLDLLNTTWIDGGRLRDLLETTAGAAIWLKSAPVDVQYKPARVTEAHRRSLLAARAAILAVAERPADARGRKPLNEILARGHRRTSLGDDGPVREPVTDEPQWLVPWLAAESYLDLLVRWPDRIRQCRHPECVLWYVDTSPAGSRRWCSMSLCGNRVKVGRHNQRASS